MLLAAGLVLGMLAIMRFPRRTREPRVPPEGSCEYCGAALDPAADRCPTCGFRNPAPAE